MSRLILLSTIVAALFCFASAILIEDGSKLYMVQYEKTRDDTDSVKFCQSIGGRVPEFDSSDKPVMKRIADGMKKSGAPYAAMLAGACREGQVIRWSVSGRPISNDLWGVGQPRSYADCSIFLDASNTSYVTHGLLFPWISNNVGHTLCVFDTTNVASLFTLMSNLQLINQTDHAVIVSKFASSVGATNVENRIGEEVLRIQKENAAKMSDFERTVFVELKDMRSTIKSLRNDAMTQAEEIQKQHDQNLADARNFQQTMFYGLNDVKMMIANLTIEMLRRDEDKENKLKQVKNQVQEDFATLKKILVGGIAP